MGGPERPWMHPPSTFSENIKILVVYLPLLHPLIQVHLFLSPTGGPGNYNWITFRSWREARELLMDALIVEATNFSPKSNSKTILPGTSPYAIPCTPQSASDFNIEKRGLGPTRAQLSILNTWLVGSLIHSLVSR